MARVEYRDGTPLFVHDVGGLRYSFSLRGYPQENWDWLCDVLGRHMDKIDERARLMAEKSRTDAIRKALGI